MKKFYSIILLITVVSIANAQNVWTQKANFGGTGRMGDIGFSIGTKGYIGLGATASYSGFSDFWEWDQATNTWTQKANYPGAGLFSGIGFSIGNFGYVGTGYDNSASVHKDFWRYDPGSNSWTQKAIFAGAARYNACSFVIGAKGYVGIGSSGGPPYLNDFWEYDPSSDSWSQKANYPLNISARAAFSIGLKGYICDGWNYSNLLNSVYEYDQSNNSWTQEANFGGANRSNDVGFSFAGKGYVGTGSNFSDFWEFDPTTNMWTQRANFGGVGRAYAVGFSIGSKGYCGTGLDGSGNLLQDFWQYSAINDGVNEINLDNYFSVYPNPTNGIVNVRSSIHNAEYTNIEVYNVSGAKVYSASNVQHLNAIDISSQPSGFYFLQIKTPEGIVNKKIIKE